MHFFTVAGGKQCFPAAGKLDKLVVAGHLGNFNHETHETHERIFSSEPAAFFVKIKE
jgi:hypothetical protein